MGNVDLDPDPGAWKLTKVNQLTWFPASQKGFCTVRRTFVGMFLDLLPTVSIFSMYQFFVTFKSDQDPDPDALPAVTLLFATYQYLNGRYR